MSDEQRKAHAAEAEQEMRSMLLVGDEVGGVGQNPTSGAGVCKDNQQAKAADGMFMGCALG